MKYEEFSLEERVIIDKFRDYLKNNWEITKDTNILRSRINPKYGYLYVDWYRMSEWIGFCAGCISILGASPETTDNILKFVKSKNFWF